MADPHWGPVEDRPRGANARRKTTTSRRRWLRRTLIAIGGLTVVGMISAIAVVVYRLHHDTASGCERRLQDRNHLRLLQRRQE